MAAALERKKISLIVLNSSNFSNVFFVFCFCPRFPRFAELLQLNNGIMAVGEESEIKVEFALLLLLSKTATDDVELNKFNFKCLEIK